MPGSDLLLWLPWALLLSAGAIVLGVRSARRGDRLGALRWAGWALVPPALLLTGTLRLVGRVFGALLDWATSLVFTPTTWLGVVLAGGAVGLIGTARALRLRSVARSGQAPEVAARAGDSGRGRSKPAARTGPDDDLAEIEDILRRRGIS